MTWWRHQMETFSALLALCAGNSPTPVNSPHKGQWHGASMFSLICAWINDWVNNREAGDLRRHRGHYDVNVMNTDLCYHRDFYPSAQIGLEGYCRHPAGGRAWPLHRYRSHRRSSYPIAVKLGRDEPWGRTSDEFVLGRRGSLIKRLTS